MRVSLLREWSLGLRRVIQKFSEVMSSCLSSFCGLALSGDFATSFGSWHIL